MNKKTKELSLCAMMAALATVIMILGGVIPIMVYCSPIIASLCLIPLIDKYDNNAAIATHITVSVLSIILSPDKESAFFWIFFSWYPIIKPTIDNRINKSRIVRLVVKICIYVIDTILMYSITCYILGINEIKESFSSNNILNLIFFFLIIIVMKIYDLMLDRMYYLYIKRFKKVIDKNF